MKIYLSFVDPISEAYREKLHTFLENILAQGITENRPPIFWFSGMNKKIYYENQKLHFAYNNRHVT